MRSRQWSSIANLHLVFASFRMLSRFDFSKSAFGTRWLFRGDGMVISSFSNAVWNHWAHSFATRKSFFAFDVARSSVEDPDSSSSGVAFGIWRVRSLGGLLYGVDLCPPRFGPRPRPRPLPCPRLVISLLYMVSSSVKDWECVRYLRGPLYIVRRVWYFYDTLICRVRVPVARLGKIKLLSFDIRDLIGSKCRRLVPPTFWLCSLTKFWYLLSNIIIIHINILIS